MKLKEAYICVQCEEIFSPTDCYRFATIEMAACPSCGNSVTFPVSRWLKTCSNTEHKDRGGD